VRKADSQYWWTLGEHRADCKPLVLRTAFHGLEEGTVSALTKLEAALTLRRNLPERHVYDQLSRHAAEHGTIVSSAPACTWFQVLSASGKQLIHDAQTRKLHITTPHLQLQQTPPEPVSNPSPVQVISWDPSRPWRGPTHQPAQLGSPCTCKVSCVARIICHLGCGVGAASQLISWWSKDPSMTLAAFQSLWCHSNTLASVTSPSGDVEDRLDLQLHLSATCPVLLC